MGSQSSSPADDAQLIVDGVGIFWATFATVWTLALLAGVTFLLLKRRSQLLRIRGIPLSVCAVCFLHCYWVSVQLGYIVRDVMPGDAEYWIMGTWLPFGIGLFHASNSRFLHIARAQKRFIQQKNGKQVQEQQHMPKQSKGLVFRFRRMDHTSKVFTLVGAGIVVQIFVTVLVFLISRKWHSSWGIPGTEAKGATRMERNMDMNRGWEWTHSVVWQFFWAWIVAPIILWQSRGIHDTQGWRLQTVGCCIASLHATPMWLIALYVPGMEKVNKYFIPPQWIAISIMVVEIFTIFLPCWEVFRHQTLQQETLDSIAQWEAKNQIPSGGRAKSIISGSTLADSAVTGWRSIDGGTASLRSNANESILTMGALEHVLERNPGPLLEFSALRDFSGENIAFLTSVAEWKSSIPPPPRNPEKTMQVMAEDQNTATELLHQRFNRALKIYVDYVSYHHAAFQVNLPSQILRQLESVFENAAQELYGEGRGADPATPFEAPEVWTGRPSPTASEDGSSEKSMVATTRDSTPPSPGLQNNGDAWLPYWGAIPADFKNTIFDEAEASVKYLVLTNTWPKFVKERRSSMDSGEVV